MSALIEERLAAWLATQGQGTVNRDIFLQRRPTKPLACLCLRRLTASGPHTYHGTRFPHLLLTVRRASEQAALQKADELLGLLHGRHHLDLGGGLYCYGLTVLSEPTSLGDETLPDGTGYLAGFNLEILQA